MKSPAEVRRRPRVAVVGGGIAGLALAAALDPTRFDVQVLEAEPGRAWTGGALALWPSARRALASVGALDRITPEALSPVSGALRDLRTGRARVPHRQAPLRMVVRPALLAALEGSVPRGVERVTATVRARRSDDAHADRGLDLAGDLIGDLIGDLAEDLGADLVVGADGVRSVVRGLVHPPAAARRGTPYVALRGLTGTPPPAGAAGEYWGRDRLAGLLPLGEGAYWFTTHRTARPAQEPLDAAQTLAEVRARFADAAPALRAVVEGSDASQVVATRIWVAPPMPRYARGRYAVIGDAAHAMTPNLGRGACDAIVDAVTLARALDGWTGEEPPPLRRWQARRLPATQAARLASGGLMRLALSGV